MTGNTNLAATGTLVLDAKGGSVVGCYHTGWLGQWLCIYPARELVAVRLRAFKSEAEAERPEYELGRFRALVDALP